MAPLHGAPRGGLEIIRIDMSNTTKEERKKPKKKRRKTSVFLLSSLESKINYIKILNSVKSFAFMHKKWVKSCQIKVYIFFRRRIMKDLKVIQNTVKMGVMEQKNECFVCGEELMSEMAFTKFWYYKDRLDSIVRCSQGGHYIHKECGVEDSDGNITCSSPCDMGVAGFYM